MARGGEGRGRGRADPRRGAGRRRGPRRSGWATNVDLGIGDAVLAQRAVTVVGRLANPRTLMEWTRRGPVGVDVVVGHPGHELLEHDAGLEPGQGRTQAEMAPAAEADELGGVAVEVVAVGVVEHVGIAVGRSDEQQDALAVGEHRAEELDLARGDPQQHLRGGVVAQGLLHPVRGARRRRPVPWPSRRGSATPSTRRWRGAWWWSRCPATTIRKRNEMISSSLSRSPSMSASISAEVRSSRRRPATLGHHVGEVAGQDESGLHALVGHVEDALLAVHEQIGEAPDLGPVGRGDADHLRDHVHGELPGHVAHHVERPHLDGGVEVARRPGRGSRARARPPAGG